MAHLDAQSLTAERIRTVQEFAAEVNENLEAMNNDYGAMRGLIEALDVQVTLTVEDGEKVVNARSIVGEDSWPASDTTFGVLVQSLKLEAPATERDRGSYGNRAVS
jgi:hypothetical protein